MFCCMGMGGALAYTNNYKQFHQHAAAVTLGISSCITSAYASISVKHMSDHTGEGQKMLYG